MANGKMKKETLSFGKVQEMMNNEMGAPFTKGHGDGKNHNATNVIKESKLEYANWDENAGGKLSVDGKRRADSQKSHSNKV